MMADEIKILDVENIKLNKLREICQTIPDVCLNLILEYSHCFEGKLKCLLKGHKLISGVEQLPNGKIISFGGYWWEHPDEYNFYIQDNDSIDNTIRIWDCKTGKLLLLIDNMEWILQFLILKNSNVCIRDNTGIKIYDTNTGEIISNFSESITPSRNFINELLDGRIIFDMDTTDQWKIIILDPKTQVTEIHYPKYKFYNKSSINKSTAVLPNDKFAAVIIKDNKYQICLFDLSIGFQNPEYILYYDTYIHNINIQLHVISNNQILFYKSHTFPVIIDFTLKTSEIINLDKVMGYPKCRITNMQFISPNKGLFSLNIENSIDCVFLILNFITFKFNLYRTNSYIPSVNIIFNYILEDQIVYGNGTYREIIVYDFKDSKTIIKHRFKTCDVPTEIVEHIYRSDRTSSGIILNNLNIIIPTKNIGELAIYY